MNFKDMDWVGFAAVVGAMGTIILGIIVPLLNSRSSRKDKELERRFSNQDKELERRFAEEDERKREQNKKANQIIYDLYSYLWALFNNISADRVSIVQPHPCDNPQYISVSFEVVKHGISPQIDSFQHQKMSEWLELIEIWRNNEYKTYKDVAEMVLKKKLYPEAHRRGCVAVAFYRLIDNSGHWIGTLVVDYTSEPPPIHTKYWYDEIKRYGELIADILPEYTP